ncbi:major facilitator superfamily domain-containing protein 1-like [Paramacrobiotus metropolitanus]|uniref:major facilitator superfamily domain-containing protein 1-like n=1 Tax=Paramacrobiotus metropolitanus TaxID=2943436 RepID=UPI00244587F6|nr:major facilitator superfamily domain-containing protein 1-like [Paramacrobiotus metropolitanus]
MGKERWFILFYCCVVSFAVDFFYDEPSALVQRLTAQSVYCVNGTDQACLHLDMVQFNSFFSGASWASAVAAIVAGICVDRYGAITPLWLSMGFLFAGSVMFAAGSYAASNSGAFGWMLSGRILYGLGTGAAVTICHQLKAIWFQYDELAVSFGLHIVAGRIGSAAAYAIIGTAVTSIGLSNCLWIGCGVTVLACVAIVGLVNREERIIESGIPVTVTKASESFRTLDGLYWCFAVVAFLMYGTVSTFTANGVALVADVYGRTETVSSLIVGLVYDISLITPFLAIFLDKFGKRDYWVTSSSIFLLAGLLFFLIPACPPWVLPVFIGIAYSIFPTTVYSSLPLIVPQRSMGVANGVIKFGQYAGIGSLTLAGGAILDLLPTNDNRRWLNFALFLAGMAVLALVIAVVINFLNAKTGKRLTPSQRERRQAADIEEVTPISVDFGVERHGSVVRETVEVTRKISPGSSLGSLPPPQRVSIS